MLGPLLCGEVDEHFCRILLKDSRWRSCCQQADASGFQSVLTLIHSYPTHLQQLDTQHRKKSSRPLRMATTIQPTCEFHVGFNFLQTSTSKRFFTCLWLRKQSQTVTWNLILALFGPPKISSDGGCQAGWLAQQGGGSGPFPPDRPPAALGGAPAAGAAACGEGGAGGVCQQQLHHWWRHYRWGVQRVLDEAQFFSPRVFLLLNLKNK